jgi:hypothetical protein
MAVVRVRLVADGPWNIRIEPVSAHDPPDPFGHSPFLCIVHLVESVLGIQGSFRSLLAFVMGPDVPTAAEWKCACTLEFAGSGDAADLADETSLASDLRSVDLGQCRC